MQLVLCNNRIVAHGENFLAMGGTVINTETGAKYENATVAECDGCPSDIDKVGYEYHAGQFVPCAPYGKGNNSGYFMEVCADCATPRSSGIPIKKGIKLANLNAEVTANALGGAKITLLWENASPTSHFDEQTITLTSSNFDFLFLVFVSDHMSVAAYDDSAFTALLQKTPSIPKSNDWLEGPSYIVGMAGGFTMVGRTVTQDGKKLTFSEGRKNCCGDDGSKDNGIAKPYQIYGVKI